MWILQAKEAGVLYSVTLKCGTEYFLHELEQAGVSYVPCGQINGQDQPIFAFAHLWGERRQVTLSSFGRKAHYGNMVKMTGVQIMTGKPTYRPAEKQGYFYYLNDIDIEHRLIEKYPEQYARICAVYRDAVEGQPCEIETKSQGRRLSAYTMYGGPKMAFRDADAAKNEKRSEGDTGKSLRPEGHKDTDRSRKGNPSAGGVHEVTSSTPLRHLEVREDTLRSDSAPSSMLLEIFCLKGLSRIDHRYSQVSGSLLDIPTLPKSALIEIHGIISEVGTEKTEEVERVIASRSQIGDLEIEWDSKNLSQLFPTLHCQATSHTSNRDEVRFKRYPDLFSATGEPCVDGKCFNCGGWWWEIPPAPSKRRGAPVRLFVDEHEHETQEIEDQRVQLRADLLKWIEKTEDTETQEILNVTIAAGVGKTTTSVKSIENILYIAPTKDLADQAFSIADDLERDCWRHRPRMHNRDRDEWDTMPLGLEADERPCVYPEICNDLAMRGYDSVPNFCAEKCEWYAECALSGYLKQVEIEKNKQSVFIAYDECYFSDVRFKSRVEKIINDSKILVCDEPTPHGLTQQREIDLDELLTTFDVWRIPNEKTIDVAFFLKTLLEKLSTAKEPDQIRHAIKISIQHLNAEDIDRLDDALSKIPVGIVWKRDMLTELYAIAIFGNKEHKVALSDDMPPPEGFDGTIPTMFVDEEKGVEIDKLKTFMVTLDTLERMGFVDIMKDPNKVPRRYVNFVSDLRAFIDCGSKACQRVGNHTILFTLPPSLNAPRGITLTASDTDDLISLVYDGTGINVTTLQGPPPPFMSGCKFFQISTGRYTPASGLLQENKNDTDLPLLSPIMRRMLTTILRVADSKLTLVVGPKALEKLLDKHEEDMLLHQIERHPNIEVINHYHAEGSNSYEDYECCFVFHFEPSVSEIEKIVRQVNWMHNVSFEREETDIVVDGVTLKKVMRYKDERVQRVFDRECNRRMMQAEMRLRPMLHIDKILFSLSAEPISRMPIQPIPFTLPQLERFILKEQGDVAEFDEYLEKLNQRTAKEVQQQDGVSRRQAFYQTEKQNKTKKQERKDEAYRLYTKENLTYEEIANALGVKSHTTIMRWLKKYDF